MDFINECLEEQMRRWASFLIIVLALSLCCTAVDETGASATSAPGVSKVEVFGGYGYMGFNSGSGASFNGQNTNGWDLAATYNFNRYLGITADFSGQYGSEFLGLHVPGTGLNNHITSFLFGPTVAYRTRSKLTPFAHCLLGVSHISISGFSTTDSQNAFGMAVGGGLDYKINKIFSIRPAQFDYTYASFSPQVLNGSTTQPTIGPLDTSQNHFRYSAGVVIKLF
jgi:opacity protein-like surface antigen